MLYKNEKFSSHTFKDASKCHKQYSQLDQHLILSQVSSQCNSNQARILRMQTMKTTYATNTSVCNQHKCQVIRTVPTLQQNTDVRRGTNSERNTETFEGERTVEGTRRRPKGNGQSKEHGDQLCLRRLFFESTNNWHHRLDTCTSCCYTRLRRRLQAAS